MPMTSTIEFDDGAAPINTEHLIRARRERILSWVMPLVMLLLAIGA